MLHSTSGLLGISFSLYFSQSISCNMLLSQAAMTTHFCIRYVYIPLGGSQKKLLNVWVVFTFVAVWHDLEW